MLHQLESHLLYKTMAKLRFAYNFVSGLPCYKMYYGTCCLRAKILKQLNIYICDFTLKGVLNQFSLNWHEFWIKSSELCILTSLRYYLMRNVSKSISGNGIFSLLRSCVCILAYEN